VIRLIIPEIGDEEVQAVADVLLSGYLVQGRHVERFEQQVAAYVGVKHAIALSSGTAALHLALAALEIGPGDEVIVPDFTFPATANVVALLGATPVLVDIDPATFNVRTDQILPVISPRTRAILPVHLFGQPADMQPILDLAASHGLAVVEDAACALGALYRGRPCGALGTMGCFSFHPRKVITTGEGGMVVTDDDALAGRLRLLRNHGMAPQAQGVSFVMAGFNYRMTDFQGAMGVVQMTRLEGIVQRRMALADLYQRALATAPRLTRPVAIDGVRHIWQSYVVLLDEQVDRAAVMTRLRAQGIETTIGTYAVSAQPVFAAPGRQLPGSLRAFQHGLCLPLHSRMTASDVEEVVECLLQAIE
jgi:dTDP-4-amino-4,6-dideoxygalactose transaminase